jgi:hypothetical protein
MDATLDITLVYVTVMAKMEKKQVILSNYAYLS